MHVKFVNPSCRFISQCNAIANWHPNSYPYTFQPVHITHYHSILKTISIIIILIGSTNQISRAICKMQLNDIYPLFNRTIIVSSYRRNPWKTLWWCDDGFSSHHKTHYLFESWGRWVWLELQFTGLYKPITLSLFILYLVFFFCKLLNKKSALRKPCVLRCSRYPLPSLTSSMHFSLWGVQIYIFGSKRSCKWGFLCVFILSYFIQMSCFKLQYF